MTPPNEARSLAARFAAAGLDWIVPEWPAPPQVYALTTTRHAALGLPWLSERETAQPELRRWLPDDPVWLAQVHGTSICDADAERARGRSELRPQADGAFARTPTTVCAVLCADCLPVLFTDIQGRVVAAAHAGWRGLAAGVLEAALGAMRVPPANVLAWLGPAIGPRSFEVGADVLDAHCVADPGAAECFAPHRPGKWLGDLYALARRRLTRSGVHAIYGGGRCTFSEPELFHSYRRDGASTTGRMATLIWISPV
jgi:purine-nucleoside/S-methyl-5'-thioadenosine phosphorylase / adenosine deaminase